ncbi:MAG: ribosome silencing factor [Nevskiales bacterium]
MSRLEGLTATVVKALGDIKGLDIKVLEVEALTPLTSRMVICSGTSARQVRALADNVMQEARHFGYRLRGAEGLQQSEWVLVDLGDVVVHVMQIQTRALYQLEKLWDTGMRLQVAAR